MDVEEPPRLRRGRGSACEFPPTLLPSGMAPNCNGTQERTKKPASSRYGRQRNTGYFNLSAVAARSISCRIAQARRNHRSPAPSPLEPYVTPDIRALHAVEPRSAEPFGQPR